MCYLLKQIIILNNLLNNKNNNNNNNNKKEKEKAKILKCFQELILKNDIEQQKEFNRIFNYPNPYCNTNEIIDFLSIVRNGEFYYRNIFPNIYKNITENLNVRFFIYENNSTDNTKKILTDLSNKYDNIIIKTDTLCKLPSNRIRKIILARNKLKEFYMDYYFEKPIDNNFVVLWDTDIIFTYEKTLKPLIELSKELSKDNKKYSMLLSFGIFTGYNEIFHNFMYRKKLNPEELVYFNLMLNYYYDTLALNHGRFFRKKTFDFFYNHQTIKVETGFGGLSLIKRNLYLSSYYDDYKKNRTFNNNYFTDDLICEHWGFSERIRNNGEIYLTKNAENLWYQDIDIDIHNNCLRDYVKYFINNKKFNIYTV